MYGSANSYTDSHHQYQGLSVVTDTALKKTPRMDSEMKQLEKDIEQNQEHLCHLCAPNRIEQHRVILVNPLEVIPYTYM